MPNCYLLVVTGGSALDQDTNAFTLFSLVEELTIEVDQPLNPSQPLLLAVEVHTYWSFHPEEYDNKYEMRLVFETEDDTKISNQVYPLKSNKPRHRIRIRGLEILALGNSKLQVEWKSKSGKKWKRASVVWPLQINYFTKKEEK